MKEIRALGRRIEIRYVSKAELKELDPEDGEDFYGFYSNSEYTIYLWSGLSPEASKRVLLHELMHAMLDMTGLGSILADDLEEALCNLNENMLELFKDKKLQEYLD